MVRTHKSIQQENPWVVILGCKAKDKWGMIIKSYGASFGVDENVLKVILVIVAKLYIN